MKNFKLISRYIKEYPELVYNNKGYESLSEDTYERHKDIIAEIESILRPLISGFKYFTNFTLTKDGYKIRIQINYNEGSSNPPFIGVAYFPVEEIDNVIIFLDNENKDN